MHVGDMLRVQVGVMLSGVVRCVQVGDMLRVQVGVMLSSVVAVCAGGRHAERAAPAARDGLRWRAPGLQDLPLPALCLPRGRLRATGGQVQGGGRPHADGAGEGDRFKEVADRMQMVRGRGQVQGGGRPHADGAGEEDRFKEVAERMQMVRGKGARRGGGRGRGR